MSERCLNHFSLFAFQDAFWQESAEGRGRFLHEFSQRLPELADRVHMYLVYPARPETDILVWCVIGGTENEAALNFFVRFAQMMAPWRRFVRPVNTLWGFTRPSIYFPGRSEQRIDSFTPSRLPYLVIYPFTKTTEWYLMSKEARQAQMNEHIKVGKQYPEITQLLLYSCGLQDQEFVVAYETDDLARFSDLVNHLRSTEVRRYTLEDTPIYTAMYQRGDEMVKVFG